AYILINNRHKAKAYYKKALKFTVIMLFIFTVFTALAGDISAKFLAEHQPEKLAAAEWHFETEEAADLILFGRLTDDNVVKNAIRIPKALSFLAFSDFNAEVKGLEEYPDDELPALWVHYMFDLLVMVGMYSLVVTFIYILCTL